MDTGATATFDYWSYGQEKPQATVQEREKFATYYRDATGLDYADQRYYMNHWGRFLTADPFVSTTALENPTPGWNRYAYVQNDPVNLYDSTGLDSEDASLGVPQDFFRMLWRSLFGEEPASPPRWNETNCRFWSFDQLSSAQQGLLGSAGRYESLGAAQRASFLNLTFEMSRLGIDFSRLELRRDGIRSDRLLFSTPDDANLRNLIRQLDALVALGIPTPDRPSSAFHPGMADWGYRATGTTFSLQIGGGEEGIFVDIDRFNPTDGVAGAVLHLFGEFAPNTLAKYFRRVGGTNPFGIGRHLYGEDPGHFPYDCYTSGAP